MSQPDRRADDSATAEPITVFSDYVCPFCYLGRASLAAFRERRDDPPATEWHPFDLRGHKRGADGEIDESVDDGKDDDYFAQVRENVARLSEEYGVELDLEAVPDIDSWNAQQAALYVRDERPDRFEAFDDAVFEAYWTDHRDVGDPDVLAELAADAGLDPEAVRTALASDEWESRLEARFRDAKEMGVTGVPTFAYRGHAARGAVPPEQLERLVAGE
ncbi:DsbA family oxidoreductase [Candidatus Halobonum tyrrellensis]|uniref:DSBA oxidoreductase n=1 Tax=Candidatus Halobonum tyrrellensis G22 TaxID=1324957 RepID=V4GV17_9EURY|nr:DsbA family oxidoreductase [Candidatus Halobonum tyrrellensis]ESP88981.1 DSBA oxidoreductase [Candidatus Halobonum tyrrellensis G22]